MTQTPLETELKALIRQEGPISIARLMELALGHPRHGYYRTRDPFGPAGDFVTAPEISQMFGELLGLWAADLWRRLGAPRPVCLVELGPGRGTLMADALRAIGQAMPEFRAALRVALVETSPVLRAAQARALAPEVERGLVTWHDHLAGLPDASCIVVANEFFDALPLRQFVRRDGRWHERLVGLEKGELAFGLAPTPSDLPGAPLAPEGAVLERGEDGLALFADLAARLARHGGGAVVIDYGSLTSGLGDTLQAVRRHRPVPVLAHLGEADLTAHVDFAALARLAQRAGLVVESLSTQADFLEALGLGALAARLAARATPDEARAIEAGRARLADRAPTGMGALFKAMTLRSRATGQTDLRPDH